MSKEAKDSHADRIEELIYLIKILRGPNGCPWDRSRSFDDLCRYLLEETYEVVDAIVAKDVKGLSEELGDLLFQVLFLIRMAEDEGMFRLEDVVTNVLAKMIRRHPHVFGPERIQDVEVIKKNWDVIKRDIEGKVEDKSDLLAGVSRSMPALMKAQLIQEKASAFGFDWTDVNGVVDKVEEEWRELREILHDENRDRVAEEIGDCLFAMVNLCRFIGVDAEGLMRKTVDKFARRFTYVSEKIRERGMKLGEVSLEEMDRLWEEAKTKDL
ncbi:MAG: nucleoside triphosphate pyrophosphohydrolase [Syntrophales bacterium]|nr:nucleoside triphosphate pyrophosphohydrolase [Syntrophales bacterium]